MDIFLIGLLIGFSALFSATETAFTSCSRVRLLNLADQGNKKASKTLDVLEKFDKASMVILLCDSVVNITAAALSTFLLTKYLGYSRLWASILITTVVILIFGELIPKAIAKVKAESFAMFIVVPFNFLTKILSPVTFILLGINNILTRCFGKEEERPAVTEEDLKYIIDEIEDEGILEENETDLVKSALDFGDITVNEILIPRVNIVAIEKDDDLETIKATFLTELYSRLPVYDKTIDNIIGVIHEKNFFKLYLSGETDISSILQDVAYFSEHKPINLALEEMQKDKIHMAVVVGQYGGTEGIITLEDIIEELVGEIYDENDEVDTSFIKLEDNKYEVSAELSIRDFLDNIELPEDMIENDSTSIGGWVMSIADHIPKEGEIFEDQGFNFTILKAEAQSIERILIEVLEKPDNEDDEDEE